MSANWITLVRFPLLAVNVWALYRGSPGIQVAAAGLLVLGMLLDTVDGVVARKTGTTSLFGSVLDIAADRTYELVLWFCFADLGLIPVVIPLVVVGRTALTDAIRAVGVGAGTAPFAQHRTRLGRFLVGSTPMRTGYSAAKTTAFVALALAQALARLPGWGGVGAGFGVLGRGAAWAAFGLCLLRGVPVVVRGVRAYWRPAPVRA